MKWQFSKTNTRARAGKFTTWPAGRIDLLRICDRSCSHSSLLRGTSVGHCCHPYDLCTKLIAEEAGVIVTDPIGSPIRLPLDTESNVAWVGYANASLHSQIAPVLDELLRKHEFVSTT